MSFRWTDASPGGRAASERRSAVPAAGPGGWETATVAALLFLLMIPAISRAGGMGALMYSKVGYGADGPAYIDNARAILKGPSAGADAFYFLLGMPATVALAASAGHVSEVTALAGLGVVSSIAAAVLAQRLFGGAAAILGIAGGFFWLGFSLFAGSEPLFGCLLLGAMAAARSGNGAAFSLLASLATTVRPPGLILLVVQGLALLRERRWRELSVVAGIAGVCGAVYLGAFAWLTGRPFGNFARYSGDVVPGEFALTVPFRRLAESAGEMMRHEIWTVWLPDGASILASLLLTVAIWAPFNREWRARYPAEAWFGTAYVLFFLSYNLNGGIATEWPRFLAPVLPLLAFAAARYLPSRRVVLWPCAASLAALGLAKMVHFNNVFGFAVGANGR